MKENDAENRKRKKGGKMDAERPSLASLAAFFCSLSLVLAFLYYLNAADRLGRPVGTEMADKPSHAQDSVVVWK